MVGELNATPMKLEIYFADGLVGHIVADGKNVTFSNSEARDMYEWARSRSGMQHPDNILRFLHRQSGSYFSMELTETERYAVIA